MNQIETIRQTLRHIVSAEMREEALKALSVIENRLISDFLTRGTITLPTPAKCPRCNNTGSWGGVVGHLYPCTDVDHPAANQADTFKIVQNLEHAIKDLDEDGEIDRHNEEAIEEAARSYFSLQVQHLKRQKGN